MPKRDWVDGIDVAKRVIDERDEAEVNALAALGRYKFVMFGYWAGIWVHLNRLIGDGRANPFRELVVKARAMQ